MCAVQSLEISDIWEANAEFIRLLIEGDGDEDSIREAAEVVCGLCRDEEAFQCQVSRMYSALGLPGSKLQPHVAASIRLMLMLKRFNPAESPLVAA